MNILRKIRRWWRSAITGRFVECDYAKANPATTVEEKTDAGALAKKLKRKHRTGE